MLSLRNRMATADAIRALAEQHGVAYTRTAPDLWAPHVSRLADDEITLDETELLLIALQRAGDVTRAEALQLQAEYLREAQATPPCLKSSKFCDETPKP